MSHDILLAHHLQKRSLSCIHSQLSSFLRLDLRSLDIPGVANATVAVAAATRDVACAAAADVETVDATIF